ncbi:MAG: glycosyltransferase [Prevotellaceae bacterium]|jgi:glycosyltransferase involved in cell wall biosynthesis|nr:glycosyltransferase [Prevotellaceae bacterium]
MKVNLLSILIPVFNESECLPLLYAKLCEITATLPCETEIVFVNDGSIDDTLERLIMMRQNDSRIKVIDLSRNFGKEAAVSAGIAGVNGDALVILDADLQDPPELIPQMLAGIEEGYDDVYGRRTARRHENRFKRWTSRQYYRLLRAISNIEVQENTGDFRMFSSKAIAALRQIKESERNMKGLFSYIGFRKKCIPYEQPPRAAGKTKWGYFKLLDLAIKGWTSFSVLPLRIISFTGVAVSFAALIYLLVVLFKALFFGDPVGGYPSMMCVILFLGGFVLLALGIIGEYLGIIYRETKKRPFYFVNKKIGDEEELKITN